jgi:hypothetical protein
MKHPVITSVHLQLNCFLQYQPLGTYLQTALFFHNRNLENASGSNYPTLTYQLLYFAFLIKELYSSASESAFGPSLE